LVTVTTLVIMYVSAGNSSIYVCGIVSLSDLSVIVIVVIGVTTAMGGKTIVAVTIVTVAVTTTDETKIVGVTMTKGETVTRIGVAAAAAVVRATGVIGGIVAAEAAVETKTDVSVIEVAIALCHHL